MGGRGSIAPGALLLLLGVAWSPGASPPLPGLEFGTPGTTVRSLTPVIVGADTVPAAPDPVSPGKADFDWKLERLDGSELSLGAFRGRVLFIHMWATWCRPCVREMAEIEALIHSLDREDVAFLLVSPEEARTVQDFLRTYGYEVPVFLEKQEMPGTFGLEALPSTFIVDRDGRIVLKRRGAANWNQDPVRAFLRKLANSGSGLRPGT